MIDSCTTNHMTPHKSLLTDIKPLHIHCLITLPNGYKVKGPFLKKPLVLDRLQKGLYNLQTDEICFSDSSGSSSVNTTTANLRPMNKSSFNSSSCASVSHVASTLSIASFSALSFDHAWHLRLAHLTFAKMKTRHFLSDKLPKKQSFICPICPIARQ
ncbi:PREDICTED: uncharacterized protein LOC109211122 isoform X2 [Nicotiana attenuata]|uniref:uncharacterized protein LOC109211122 isoform X2 n=1 Tax=Nicotiana attenuata TaxID=49451 RepID=UPI0009058367|nr:PREDICTED: uncharacterized protein LOC109211122 isoform X2 [Nicotiana attenuata]